MSQRHRRIASIIAEFQGRERDAHYFAYFKCFNGQLFFEAHEVLEELWLAQRDGANGAFYKGLIQLAGAFVHVQKNRRRQAAALFKLARANLSKYPPIYEQLHLENVIALIEDWLRKTEGEDKAASLLLQDAAPVLNFQISSA